MATTRRMRLFSLIVTGCLAIQAIAWADVRDEVVSAPSDSTEMAPSVQTARSTQYARVLPTLSESDEKMLQSMPLKRKIGQLFMFGFSGQSIEEGIGKTISSLQPGALVVFARNIKTARQISDLTIQAQKASIKSTSLPLLIAVDQEGGNVIRIKTAMPLPSALALGETGDPVIVERAGRATGQLLKTLGFNMNLAPVMDIADPNVPSFIGTRTYGNDPARVVKMGIGFASGLQNAGVMPTAKHFPGHGGINADSHRETPEKESSLKELAQQDLVPFYGMRQGFEHPWAVMLAHIALPHVDPTGLPATFSKPIVEGLLRKQMEFDGIVLTDDIEMAGAGAIKDVGERAVRAIEAGADMIMVAWNRRLQAQLVKSLSEAVSSGRIPEERINASVRRIIAAKRVFGPSNLKAPSLQDLKMAIRNPEFLKVGELTILSKLQKPELRVDREFKEFVEERPVFVFSAEERFYRLFKEGAQARPTRFYRLSANQTLNIDRVMRSNPNALGVFYVSGPRIAKIADSMSEDVARRTLLVTVETEGLLRHASSFRKIADVYFRHPQLGKIIADHYFGTPAPVSLRVPAAASGDAPPAEKN